MMGDMSGKFEVGYGKPPKQHQFKKGQSGNPKGRRKGSSNKSVVPKGQGLDFGAQPANQMLLQEAYRPVTLREGEQSIELPAIQAVFRAMGVAAIKGNRFAQRTMAALVQSIEEEDRKLRSEHMAAAIEYKTGWERAIEEARQRGWAEPMPLPHPDDVIIDLKNATVVYAGPSTPEEKRQWDKIVKRRDDAQQEVAFYAEKHRQARNLKTKEQYLREWHYEQRMFDVLNDNLPIRYRTHLNNRSYKEGATRPGNQKRNVWPE